MSALRTVATAALALAASAGPAVALDLVGGGFAAPLFLTAPAGDPRLFVVEKAGVIKIRSGGTWTPFLDINPLVDIGGERGLLGLAFDPNFASNRYFYVLYSDKTTNHDSVVARYQASAANPNIADPSSAQRILTIPQSSSSQIHRGGWIGFRPGDPNNLYIASGDGGGAQFAQALDSQLGKILRVDIRNDAFPADGNVNYAIPAGNPFAGGAANDDTVWAYGLRNPFRDSFDRQTGDLWIADVGLTTREEINIEAAPGVGGRNYGWPVFEGTFVPNPPPAIGGTTPPIFEYPHAGPDSLGRTVIGGYVYRGGVVPGLDGLYFFGDFTSGRIFSFRFVNGAVAELTERTAEFGTPFSAFELTSFGEDAFGGLYVMGLDGNVYLIAAGVPEPSTYAFLVLGLAVVAVVARRRARAPSR